MFSDDCMPVLVFDFTHLIWNSETFTFILFNYLFGQITLCNCMRLCFRYKVCWLHLFRKKVHTPELWARVCYRCKMKSGRKWGQSSHRHLAPPKWERYVVLAELGIKRSTCKGFASSMSVFWAESLSSYVCHLKVCTFCRDNNIQCLQIYTNKFEDNYIRKLHSLFSALICVKGAI